MRLLKFGFKYIDYKSYFGIYLFLCLIITLLTLYTPFIEGKLIDMLSQKVETNFINILFLLIVLILFSNVLEIIRDKIYIKIQVKSGNKLNIKLINKLYNISYTEIANEDFAELNQRLNNDANILIIYCISFIRDFLIYGIQACVMICILFSKSSFLGVVIIILIFAYYILYLYMKKKMYLTNDLVKINLSRYFSSLYHMVADVKSIKLNALKKEILEKHRIILDEYTNSLENQVKVQNINKISRTFLNALAQIVLFIFGASSINNESITIGYLLVIMQYFSQLISISTSLFNFSDEYQNALSSYERIQNYLSKEDMIFGKEKINSIDVINIKGLNYGFDKILFKINRKFYKNKIYWIKGNNGKGKTTFINLLLGIYGTNYKGEIKFNDIEHKEVNIDYLLENKIRIVEQNLNLFDFNEELDEEFLDFYKKIWGDMYENKNCNQIKSGGEKQKKAITKALLRDADMIIFDEPTASLDYKSTKIFYDLLYKFKKNRIIFIISHDNVPIYDEIVELY